jgi:hypothetical protein
MLSTNYVRPIIPQEFLPGIKTQFINSEVFRLFGTPETWSGKGTSVRLPVNIGNTSSNAGVIAEGAALKAADDSTHAEAAFALATYNASGECSWQSQKAGVGALESIVADVTDNLVNAVNVALISSLEGSCAATGTYGGLTRTSYASWGVSGADGTDLALTETNLETALEWLLTATAGGRKSSKRENLAIFANPDMYFKIMKLVDPSATRPYVRPANMPYDGGNIFVDGMQNTWNGLPVVSVQGMTTGTVIMGDPSYVKPYQASDLEVIELGKTTLDNDFTMAWYGNLVNTNPSQFYILTDKD